MPPKIARVAILNALKNLEDLNFREFCDELAKAEGKPRIRSSEVEKKSRTEVLKVLVSRCSSGAVDRAITTLKHIGCNEEAEELAAEAGTDRSQPAPRTDRSRSPHRATAEADADRLQPAPRRERSRSPLRAKPSLSRDDSSSTPRNDPKELLSSVRPDFADNVTEAVLDQLLDRLLQKKLLNKGEMESAKQKGRSEKARYVVDTVLGKGPKAASFLIKEYCELDPCSELCDKLKQ